MPQAIHTDQLSKHFGRVIALDHVDLDVPEGAVFALVGQNGAGKTTTIKVLMNLLPASGVPPLFSEPTRAASVETRTTKSAMFLKIRKYRNG